MLRYSAIFVTVLLLGFGLLCSVLPSCSPSVNNTTSSPSIDINSAWKKWTNRSSQWSSNIMIDVSSSDSQAFLEVIKNNKKEAYDLYYSKYANGDIAYFILLCDAFKVNYIQFANENGLDDLKEQFSSELSSKYKALR